MPMHPSYEDRSGVPDRVFAAVSPALAAHSAEAWAELIRRDVPPFEMAHLHHLTPIHDAMAAAAPEVPVVTHLHGTELNMLAVAERLARIANRLGATFEEMADRSAAGTPIDPEGLDEADRPLALATDWDHWRHADYWIESMRRWAQASDRLVVVAPHDQEEARRLLGVEHTTWIPNGVDLERFVPRDLSLDEKLARWRRWLVEEPLGWAEGGGPGSIAYSDADLEVFTDPATGEAAPVLLFVGRFTEVKRIPAHPGLRAGARALRSQGPAGDLGRLPGRVGRRARPHRGRGGGGR